MVLKILVVDDDSHILDILDSCLTEAGYEVETAPDGIQAMDFLVRNPPDLILADVAIPHLDGYYLCQMVRSHPVTQWIPFIFLSGKGQVKERIEGLRAGADDYITKPFHLEEVKARIETLLARTQRQQRQHEKGREAVSQELVSLQSRMEEVLQRVEDTISDAKSPGLVGTRVIAGNIQEINLIDIIQILNRSQKSGALQVDSGDQQGTLFFSQGNLVDADLGALSGKEATFELLCWERGTFEFDAEATTTGMSIDMPLENLLLEAMKRIDENRNN